MSTRHAAERHMAEVEHKTLADGTVQIKCQHEHCYRGRWFDKPATGRPPRFCSTACRVAQHRLEKARAQREADRLAREAELRRARTAHEAKWVDFIHQHTPGNGRMTRAKCQELYQAMLDAEMIDGPFPQRRLW